MSIHVSIRRHERTFAEDAFGSAKNTPKAGNTPKDTDERTFADDMFS